MGEFNESRGPRRDFGSRGPRRFNAGPVEKHKAVCSKCKKECEVPFKPTPGKEVYCQECYREVKGF